MSATPILTSHRCLSTEVPSIISSLKGKEGERGEGERERERERVGERERKGGEGERGERKEGGR